MNISSPFLIHKLLSTLALLVITFVCSYLPWGIRSKFRQSKSIISYLNCLAGGVVLGALVMHMLPEISHCGHSHAIKEFDHPHNHKEKICDHGCLSEEVDLIQDKDYLHDDLLSMHSTSKEGTKAKKPGHKHSHHQRKSHGHGHGFSWGYFSVGCSFLVLLAVDRLLMHSHAHDHDHKQHKTMKEPPEHSTQSFPANHDMSPSMDPECCGKIHMPEPEDDDCASCHSEDLVGGCHMDGLANNSSKPQALAFVMALSLHSFLEGLGMASQEDSKSLGMYLIGLFAHKWLEAFALGVNVMNADFSTAFAFVLITFYAFLTPIGILLGLISVNISISHSAMTTLQSCLNGAAVGSFLFVSCIEMIPPEFHKKTSQTIWKFVVLSLGFGLMAVFSIFHYH